MNPVTNNATVRGHAGEREAKQSKRSPTTQKSNTEWVDFWEVDQSLNLKSGRGGFRKTIKGIFKRKN